MRAADGVWEFGKVRASKHMQPLKNSSLNSHPLLKSLSVVFAFLAMSASASSTISATDRFAHAANAGWIDFRPSAGDGVRIEETHLSGYAYAANFG